MNKQSGFTLIETLIAILLLLITVVAIMSLISKILVTTRGQRLEITAQYLAQEGIEYLRNNRDSALNGRATWADFTQMGPGCPLIIGSGTVSLCECNYAAGVPGACTIDTVFNEVLPCPPSGCPNIVRVENSGRMFYCSPGTNCPGFFSNPEVTTFKRSIRLTPSSSGPDEIYADVEVEWVDTGVTRKKVLQTSLMNW